MSSSSTKEQWICGCKTVNFIDRDCDVVVCSKCGRSQLAYLVVFTPVLPADAIPAAA